MTTTRTTSTRSSWHARLALSRTAYLLTGDAQLAEDLVQTALFKAARAWHRIDGHAGGLRPAHPLHAEHLLVAGAAGTTETALRVVRRPGGGRGHRPAAHPRAGAGAG